MDTEEQEEVYYNVQFGERNQSKTRALRDFHNLYVKKLLISGVSRKGDTLIDYACGKAGDLPKWIHSHLSFVFGIDVSKDNLENRLDGACVRYLESRKRNKNMPYSLFVNGNSAFNIRSGAAMLNDKAVQITKAIFGSGSKEKVGEGVARQYGVGQEGFQISSVQFAIHYFFENPDTLQGFMRNISECTKVGGYFIGTAYDGKTIFQLLKKKEPGETIQIIEEGKKIWELTKGYQSSVLEDNSSSIGYRIDVFQESINQVISEYLVNFDYLVRVMEDYGFTLIDREEAKELGLPEGSGLFSELFLSMLEEIKKNDSKKKEYGKAPMMNSFEKKISFLNRYFVFKKRREVNTSKVQLELADYDDFNEEINRKETQKAMKVGEEETKQVKPKIRKLGKKIVLMESLVSQEENLPEKVKVVKAKKNKKKLIIEDDDE
jgi:mRNA (guanine-N7-)-methyltransferase